jgi:hypothetical protein
VLEEVPQPGDPTYDAFRAMMLELSLHDREVGVRPAQRSGAYKLTGGSDWVVTPREAGWLADAAKNRTPHRHKITTNQEHWLAEWTAFNQGEGGAAGYVVESM